MKWADPTKNKSLRARLQREQYLLVDSCPPNDRGVKDGIRARTHVDVLMCLRGHRHPLRRVGKGNKSHPTSVVEENEVLLI